MTCKTKYGRKHIGAAPRTTARGHVWSAAEKAAFLGGVVGQEPKDNDLETIRRFVAFDDLVLPEGMDDIEAGVTPAFTCVSLGEPEIVNPITGLRFWIRFADRLWPACEKMCQGLLV